MKRVDFNRGIGALVLALAPLALAAVEPQMGEDTVTPARTVTTGSVQLSSQNSLLSGRAAEARLAEALQALRDATGATVVENYMPEDTERVSFEFSDLSFRDALKEILYRYNYAVIGAYDASTKPRVILIGWGEAPEPTASDSHSDIDTPVIVEPEVTEANVRPEDEVASTEELVRKPADKAPRDLDAFQPLSRRTARNDTSTPDGVPKDESGRELFEEERAAEEALLRQERVDRAVAALHSPYQNLYTLAIDDVKGLDDPRVSATLRDGALGEIEGAGGKKAFAKALWEHAADLEFKDEASLSALRELSSSNDPRVNAVARQALEDSNRYLQRQQQRAEEASTDPSDGVQGVR